MSALPSSDPRAPKYWRNETSGLLAQAIEAYLESRPMGSFAVAAVRAYLRQWIDSPAWDMNPAADDESRRELAGLRAAAAAIETRRDIDEWLYRAIEFGADPL